ncbi:MAG: sigma-70 family RNA polymerase sigma factor [Archangium sp.]|nr:sigma-70 family RNA polymerase sigma factor [Archangium sp.]
MTALASIDPTEVEWLALARRGDRPAFERLFLRYAPMVHGVLLARVQRADADDLMQDVFVTALERLSTFAGEEKLGAWLATVARHKVIDAWRTRPKLMAASEATTAQPPRREANEVLAVIRTLPEAYREPLVLRLVEGLSGPEIAEQVGLTPQSVRVNLCRGMKLLRERLGLAPEASDGDEGEGA